MAERAESPPAAVDGDLSEELLLQLAVNDMTDLLDGYDLAETPFQGEELAYKLYLEELRTASQLASDRKLALSMGDACAADQTFVHQAINEETQAMQDHREACRLAGQTPRRAANPEAENVAAVADEDVARYAALNSNTGETQISKGVHDLLAPLTKLEVSRTTALPKVTKVVSCVCCGSKKAMSKTIAGTCGDHYCGICIVKLFQMATVDESLFPPRCCRTPLPVDRVRPLMPANLEKLFDEKSLEFTTPNRTYCANVHCSKFIAPQHINADVGSCPACLRETCTICKAQAHQGECPEDPAVKQLLETAEENGWRKCYSCNRMIGIHTGCNHMTCLCKAEFCYNCGAKWQTCTCPLWDEQRLYEAAVVRVERAGEVPVAQAIARAGAQIRQDHECRHRRARYTDEHEPGHQARCENCNRYTPLFAFVCDDCPRSMCITCYKNRR